MHYQIFRLLVLVILLSIFTGCHSTSATQPVTLPPAQPLPDEAATSEAGIRFLEDRVKRDPDDMISYNMLVTRYLQRLRESGNITYLELATRAAQSSLKVLPAEHNIDGLALLAEVEFASHNFATARDYAKKLMEFAPNKLFPFQLMGDAQLELGDYRNADATFFKLNQFNDGSANAKLAIETRLGRLELLHGRVALAQNHFATALNVASKMSSPPRETIAWCRWQLGEVAFSQGDYDTAMGHYQDALTTFPDYFRALASLARVKAAKGDLPAAIAQYQRATQVLPDITFVAALGDLYKLTGQTQLAQAQYQLVEQIAKLSALNGVLYNRNLALFYADHDMKAEEAYLAATKEYEQRHDIYGADAVAWTALKAGKLNEAQTAIKEALKLETQDAMLFYHAGMIALATNDKSAAKDYLSKALKLNPFFSPLQAGIAKKFFDQLNSADASSH